MALFAGGITLCFCLRKIDLFRVLHAAARRIAVIFLAAVGGNPDLFTGGRCGRGGGSLGGAGCGSKRFLPGGAQIGELIELVADLDGTRLDVEDRHTVPGQLAGVGAV
mgnify:CR=1 FL=1